MNAVLRFSYAVLFVVLAGLTGAAGQSDSAGLKAPAHLKEALEMLDLRRLPPLAGGSRHERTALYCKASFARLKPNQVVPALLQELGQEGWSEVANARRTQLGEIETVCTKQGFFLLLNCKGLNDPQVLLQLRGNVDARDLPRAADASDVELRPELVTYRSREKPEVVRGLLRRELAQAGWHSYSPPPVPGKEADDAFSRFLRNGMSINALIFANEGVTSVVQSANLLSVELPIPTSARDVQFQEKPVFLQYRSARGLEEAAAACERDLNELGWKRVDAPSGQRIFQLPGQAPLYLDAQRDGDGAIIRLAAKPFHSP